MPELKGLHWAPRWVSHLGCIIGCLDYLGVEISDAWLYGGTGHAFIINMHETVCPSGPTAWNTERMGALGGNLGYEVDGVFGMRGEGDGFSASQSQAWDLVRSAIDRGLPCYGWELDIAEYYVIYGYDDQGYIFSGPPCTETAGHKRWQELGDTETGLLEMYSLRPAKPADPQKTVREALSFALEHAAGPARWVFPHYASGLAGYDAWIGSLQAGTADPMGMAYNAAVWHECRGYAVPFLEEAKVRLPLRVGQQVDAAAEHYRVVSEQLAVVAEAFPFEGMEPGHVQDPGRRASASAALRAARASEEAGLVCLREIVESF